MRMPLYLALCCGLAATAGAEFADYRFVPPAGKLSTPKAAIDMASEAVNRLKQNAFPAYAIDDYAGKRDALRQASTNPGLQVGVGAELAWSGVDLFDTPETKGNRQVWRAAITSADATALRLNIDLSGLDPDDEVWIIDTPGGYAFGPYTLKDAETQGNWMPTTMGDTAILLVSSTAPAVPPVTVTKLSHFYEEFAGKGADCPLSADCITDTALREISTGIGRMTVTDDNGNSFLCSGALLNNALTEDLESFFLTADHCFQGAPAPIQATSIEVVWDMRTNGCPGSEPSAGQIAALPRSSGTSFIANSTGFDAMLMALGNVPVGTLGRAYVGWDTQAPRVGEPVAGIHHPFGTAMKECLGRVDDIGVDSSFGLSQTTINWREGITEGGSSGSPVLFDDDTFRVFGMLSNGNVQSCDNNNARLDQYSSFQAFFSAISGSLNSATPVTSGQLIYAQTGDGPGGIGSCIAVKAKSLGESSGDMAVAGVSIMALLLLGMKRRQHR